MKVSELIERLGEFDPEMDVCRSSGRASSIEIVSSESDGAGREYVLIAWELSRHEDTEERDPLPSMSGG